jgi:hypothetical protein
MVLVGSATYISKIKYESYLWGFEGSYTLTPLHPAKTQTPIASDVIILVVEDNFVFNS